MKLVVLSNQHKLNPIMFWGTLIHISAYSTFFGLQVQIQEMSDKICPDKSVILCNPFVIRVIIKDSFCGSVFQH